MVQHYFQTPNPDLAAIQKRLVFWFKEHEYEVDSAETDGVFLVQARKTGKFRTLTGTNIAFKIRIYLSEVPDEFVFESATGQWVQNITGAGVTALFTGGLTLLTGAVGAAWVVKVERDIVEFMEHTLRFKKTKTIENKSGANQSAPPPVPASIDPPPLVQRVATSVVTANQSLSPRERAVACGKSDLAKLEAAHAAGILTDDELAAKSNALAARIDAYEVQFVIEEKAAKLKAALADGILDQAAYDSKYASLEQAAKEAIQKERMLQDGAGQLGKLKIALANGILSQEEYDQKASMLR